MCSLIERLCPPSPGKPHARAVTRFTLIELLVVISIIAILMAILLPVLSKARERARIVLCLNNHKSVATAMLMYAGDNNYMAVQHEWYTDYAGGIGSSNWSGKGPRRLNSYLGGNDTPTRLSDGAAQIMRCPSDKGDPTENRKSRWTDHGNSYRVEYKSGGATRIGFSTSVSTFQNSGNYNRVRLKDFKFPDLKVVQFSSMWNANRDWGLEQTRWHLQGFGNPRIPTAFADGHVENFFIGWRPSNKVPNYSPAKMRDEYGYY